MCWGRDSLLGDKWHEEGESVIWVEQGLGDNESNAALIFQQALQLHSSEQPEVFYRTGTHLPPRPVPATVLSSSLWNCCMSGTRVNRGTERLNVSRHICGNGGKMPLLL